MYNNNVREEATLNDVQTKSRNPNDSRKKTKRFINQYRPSIAKKQTGKSNQKAPKVDSSSRNLNSELASLFGQIMKLLRV